MKQRAITGGFLFSRRASPAATVRTRATSQQLIVDGPKQIQADAVLDLTPAGETELPHLTSHRPCRHLPYAAEHTLDAHQQLAGIAGLGGDSHLEPQVGRRLTSLRMNLRPHVGREAGDGADYSISLPNSHFI